MTDGKMTPKRAKAVIDAAFMNLSHAAESRMDPDKYLRKAFEAAFASERHHRTHPWARTGGARNSVKTAARYFVVKWYLDPGKVDSAVAAVSLREDCLYASALRQSLGDVGSVMLLAPEFGEIDYSEHIAAPV